MIPYLFITVFPFVWWAFTINHCMLHSKFVYRGVIVSILLYLQECYSALIDAALLKITLTLNKNVFVKEG